jgi:hypothetical protein
MMSNTAMAEKHQHAWKAATASSPGDAPLPRMHAFRALQAPAILLLIMAGFYWRLTLTRQYTWLDNPDGVYQVLPWLQFQAAAFHKGQLPLWDPYEWGGQPLVGQMQPGAAYPVNWILFALPLRNGFIRLGFLQWYFVLIHFMAALFCYLLCRDLKRSRPASLLAGAAFGLAGWIGTTDWPQMLNSAIWTPLLFLFLLRVMRGYRIMASGALAGTFLGLAFLAGHHQIPIFVGLAAAGFWMYLFFRDGKPNWYLIRPLLVFGIFCFLVGALQSLPAWECGKLSLRWVGTPQPIGWNEPVPYDIHSGFGLFPLSVLGIAVPGIVRNANPFVGSVLLSLAFLGIVAAWNDRTVRLFVGLALAGLLFSLAEFAFFQGVLYALLPMVDKARNPSMAIFIFQFGIIILGAYGLDSYRYVASSPWMSRLWRFWLVFAGLLYVVLLFRTLGSFQGGPDPNPIAMAALTALLLACVVYAWARAHLSPRTSYFLVFALVLIEAALFNGSEWRNRDQPTFFLKKIHQDPDIALFLKQQKAPVRVEIDSGQIPYNFGDWYGIDVFGGYLASLTSNVSTVQGLYQTRMLAGVNFYVGPQPIRPDQVQVYANYRGVKIYSNPEALPSAWAVHQVDGIASTSDIVPRMQKRLAELKSRAFLIGTPPALETCTEPDRVQLLKRDLNSLQVSAEMECRGMVIVGDTNYPGWQATIDGHPARILETYGFLRAVVVDRGTHRIEMRYRPTSVYLGAALTSVGLIGALLIGISGIRGQDNPISN